jgi:SM-20-related protein
MENHFDLLINTYLGNNVGIDPGFLSEKLSAGLQQHILELEEDKLLFAGGIGNEKVQNLQQKMRGDKIYWMEKSHTNIFEKEFLQLAEGFISHLNETCYTGINAYEFHYAVYDEGSFYKKHTDQFKTNDHRKFSLINYLNEDWADTDGGELVVYQNDTTQKIQPQSQTAVFFKSDSMEHEVTKTNRRRMSITGWLKQQ